MKKTVALAGAVVAWLALAAAPAQAYSWPNDVPDLPACASTLGGPTRPADWGALEDRCDVAVTGDDRLYVNMLELFVDELSNGFQQVSATVADQSLQLAAKDTRIARQRARIERLRERLHSH